MTTVERYDNSPELGVLSLEEHASVEAALDAILQIKKDFAHWITIGRAMQTLDAKAKRLNSGRKTFQRLREQAGLDMDKATVTRLLRIMDNLVEVTRWRESLTERQRFEWASPAAVFKHCPVFAKPKPDGEPKKLTPLQQAKQQIVALEEENHRLKKSKDDERWTPTDKAADIVTAISGMFQDRPNMIERIGHGLIETAKNIRKGCGETQSTQNNRIH
jgi:hypothetical protein